MNAENLVRLTRTEQLNLRLGDVIWVSDDAIINGNMDHCYQYTIKPLTDGRAVSGIALRDAKRKSSWVYKTKEQNK